MQRPESKSRWTSGSAGKRCFSRLPLRRTLGALAGFCVLVALAPALFGDDGPIVLKLLAAASIALIVGALSKNRRLGFGIGCFLALTAVYETSVFKSRMTQSMISSLSGSEVGFLLLGALPGVAGCLGGALTENRHRRPDSGDHREWICDGAILSICSVALILISGTRSLRTDGVPVPLPQSPLPLPRSPLLVSYQSLETIPAPQQCRSIAPWFNHANVISPDGDMLAGQIEAAEEEDGHRAYTQHGFIWTKAHGFVDVAATYPDLHHVLDVTSASRDGNNLLVHWSSPNADGVWLWSKGERLNDALKRDSAQWLSDPASSNSSLQIAPHSTAQPLAVSPDGNCVLLQYRRHDVAETVRYTPESHTERLHGLPLKPTVRAITESGDAFAGFDGMAAFVWTKQDGTVELPLLPGTTRNIAYGVSTDGRIVAGVSGDHLVRWHVRGAIEDLGRLPGSITTRNSSSLTPDPMVMENCGYSISDDGSVIVGQSGDIPFVWTQRSGIVPLTELLARCDAPIAGTPIVAAALSHDGRTITGFSAVSFDDLHRWRLTLR